VRSTPAIDALPKRARARLVREVWLFGLGRLFFLLALWALFIFLVDWVLHVPAGVRVVHLGVLVALAAYVLWRDLLQRLRCVPDAAGLAVLVERAHPQLHELLVSAVQLRSASLEGSPGLGSPELVDRVIEEADALAAQLDLANLTDPRPQRRSMALGFVASLALLATFASQWEAARIFLARVAGGSTPWPQKTHLLLEIPMAGELHSTRDLLEIAIARGSDVPVVVRSEGHVPDNVTIHFAGGREALLGSAGRGVFRTLLRSVQDDVAFHISGGDDTDGTPAVRIHVLQPPDVSRIALHVEPPAYSGLNPETVFDRDVQVLRNSKVTVSMLPDPANATGQVRLLPEDRTLKLEPAPFPGENGAPSSATGLAFELQAIESLRYRFEIQDATGLANPDPGLFAIQVEPDRPPSVQLLAPARGELESILGAALPLKAIASDDFGLSDVAWRARPSSEALGAEAAFQTLNSSVPSDPSVLATGKDSREQAYYSRKIEVAELFGQSTPAEGEVFELELRVRDNREPSQQETITSTVRLRIVSADEFLRHIQDRLARVRSKVEALSNLMGEKQGYALDLVASLESDEPGRVDASSIQSALGAARRVEGDARALSREVAAVASALIWSRVDDRADSILSELEKRSLSIADRNFHPEPWLEIVELQKQNKLGDARLADKLVEVVGLALEISEQDSTGAVAGLRRTLDMMDMTAQYDSLIEVTRLQSAARLKTEQMLSLLSEWDSYQSVLSAVRDLLNRQKNQLERTRQFHKDH
jgi:hypothetical protein